MSGSDLSRKISSGISSFRRALWDLTPDFILLAETHMYLEANFSIPNAIVLISAKSLLLFRKRFLKFDSACLKLENIQIYRVPGIRIDGVRQKF